MADINDFTAAPLDESLNGKALNKILHDTIDSIESSKGQILDIYESAQAELQNSRKMLEEIKAEARKTIDEVDEIEKSEQKEKQKLVRVSANFSEYSEERIKETYDAVKKIQIKLEVAREKERQLRRQRDRLELRLYNLQKTVLGAERLAMRISSVLGYLGSQISDVVAQMEQAAKNKFLSAAIIKAQEDERFRVSREIHDGPAQDVANLMFQTSVCERMIDIDPFEAKENLQELRRQMRACLTDIRQIIFDMRPMSLDDLGLVSALKQLVMKMRERRILNATIQVDGKEVALPTHIETAIFRIVQEALNNVNRHSGAKEAKVRILFTKEAMAILITDEGTGFDMEMVEEELQDTEGNGHFGLLGMKERAGIIGAQLTVNSAKDKGTRVHLRLPLQTARGVKNRQEMRADMEDIEAAKEAEKTETARKKRAAKKAKEKIDNDAESIME